jgi:hypothetical protein
MSAFGSDDLQNSATERLASQNDQPTGPSVLPPFSGKLSIADKLKLNKENIKQTAYDTFKDKDTAPLSQLRATPPFPTPHVLAQFTSKAYRGSKQRETDAQCEA